MCGVSRTGNRVFQSTPPSREATTSDHLPQIRLLISIHASLAGGDIAISKNDLLSNISIHASLAGGDRHPFEYQPAIRNFNPRLPRGRRLYRFNGPLEPRLFQSTPPSREATVVLNQKAVAFASISIHASLAGGDRLANRPCKRAIYFNPRLPRGRRHKIPFAIRRASDFNPRLPRGRRHRNYVVEAVRAYLISIHASLAGGDYASLRTLRP